MCKVSIIDYSVSGSVESYGHWGEGRRGEEEKEMKGRRQ
jgi:hypothetical protein